jgi:hypothetical protein
MRDTLRPVATSTASEATRAAIDFRCPACLAEPGDACRIPGAAPGEFVHLVRADLARRS